eukprot:TRINITY_DN67989_c0_g1_i1.p1 TRINITY_DN67989_c0_g1~~TRINITY_DN67989_c0_g1_i1.p1  ORF type:complete len:283 (+),score=43.29 TRINITY_DN67989_c0_g1_i1:135-983(+)
MQWSRVIAVMRRRNASRSVFSRPLSYAHMAVSNAGRLFTPSALRLAKPQQSGHVGLDDANPKRPGGISGALMAYGKVGLLCYAVVSFTCFWSLYLSFVYFVNPDEHPSLLRLIRFFKPDYDPRPHNQFHAHSSDVSADGSHLANDSPLAKASPALVAPHIEGQQALHPQVYGGPALPPPRTTVRDQFVAPSRNTPDWEAPHTALERRSGVFSRMFSDPHLVLCLLAAGVINKLMTPLQILAVAPLARWICTNPQGRRYATRIGLRRLLPATPAEPIKLHRVV